jgi:hypothetical protein
MTAIYMGTVSKYHNRRTTVDNIEFASKKESQYYSYLKLLLKSKQISDLKMQVPFELQPAFTDNMGKKQREIKYICDFTYFDKSIKLHVVDVKGFAENTTYRLKKKMFMFKYPQAIFEEV